MYKYEGQELNKPIAEELILELFAGQENVKLAEIKKRVLQEHSNRGGEPYTRQYTPVSAALRKLKSKGLADNKRKGYWTFKEDSGSETTAEYSVKDESDIRKHIEQECIFGSFKRLQPILESAREIVKDNPISASFGHYIELERLALELARYALDYYEITERCRSNPSVRVPQRGATSNRDNFKRLQASQTYHALSPEVNDVPTHVETSVLVLVFIRLGLK